MYMVDDVNHAQQTELRFGDAWVVKARLMFAAGITGGACSGSWMRQQAAAAKHFPSAKNVKENPYLAVARGKERGGRRAGGNESFSHFHHHADGHALIFVWTSVSKDVKKEVRLQTQLSRFPV